jgi:hypothetical protein
MSDTPNPPPRRLFSQDTIDISNRLTLYTKSNILSATAPPDSVQYMNWELRVLLEAEPHFRARGKDATADNMRRGIEDLQLRIAAKQAGVDPYSPEARARVRWKIPARKRLVY